MNIDRKKIGHQRLFRPKKHKIITENVAKKKGEKTVKNYRKHSQNSIMDLWSLSGYNIIKKIHFLRVFE